MHKKKLLNQSEISFFFQALHKLYPNNTTELERETPWQLLLAVMLSAQTTDKQVNKITNKFFNTVKTPYDTLTYSPEERYELLKGVNYAPTKWRHTYKTAQILIQNQTNNNYNIPNTEKELTQLPGVGEKTAKVVLHVLYDTDDIAVDTHVHRVCNRMRIVDTATPLQTSKVLPTIIPDQYKKIAHHTLIYFWRYHSTARNPKYGGSSYEEFCDYYQQLTIKK